MPSFGDFYVATFRVWEIGPIKCLRGATNKIFPTHKLQTSPMLCVTKAIGPEVEMRIAVMIGSQR
jgi:hypothetical protein